MSVKIAVLVKIRFWTVVSIFIGAVDIKIRKAGIVVVTEIYKVIKLIVP
jgi:hypothetical protein